MSESFGPDFITVTDEDGNDIELEIIGSIEHRGVTYCAFFPAVDADEETGEPKAGDFDEDEEYGLVILKVIQENGEDILSTLDTDEELEEVYQLFMEEVFQDEDED
jgi:uncharacterized protein YrzB (UPF0473 family)